MDYRGVKLHTRVGSHRLFQGEIFIASFRTECHDRQANIHLKIKPRKTTDYDNTIFDWKLINGETTGTTCTRTHRQYTQLINK